MYISQGYSIEEQLRNIEEALDAGCNWVQLRIKNTPEEYILQAAKKVKTFCEKHGATYIINDYIQIAKEIGADGVHLGLSDDNISLAREILGKNSIIGGTANTIEQVLQRINEGCDYVGVGPFRFTSTKDNLSPILGLESYNKLITKLQQEAFSTPVYAIGGITLDDVEAIRETGVYGIALSGAITNSKNKKELIEQLTQKLYGKVKSW